VQLPIWQVLILATVQGIAEFLPISSSGHLVLVADLLGVDPEQFDLVELNIALHAGTLGSILVVYRRPIYQIAVRTPGLMIALIVATIPAVIAALGLKVLGIDEVLQSSLMTACGLLATGTVLLASRQLNSGETSFESTRLTHAWWIGCAQAMAILPGISRSGSTICAGQFLGLSREAAATFSFMMAIPAILGAVVLEIVKSLAEPSMVDSTPFGVLAFGAAVSFGVGWLALKLLLAVVQTGRLHWFALWCFVVGLFVLARHGMIAFGS